MGMSQYLRPRVAGASVFFTLNTADRGGDLLVREIGALRRAVAVTRRERPFVIDAWVVLPKSPLPNTTLLSGDMAGSHHALFQPT